MTRRHDPHWKGGVDLPQGCDVDAPACARCGSETYEPTGICLECRDDAGEVLCGICGAWAMGTKGETDACFECMQHHHHLENAS